MEDRRHILREKLKKSDLDGFIIPHTDEHQCEYTPEHNKRLTWLTGFDGSAGMGAVLGGKGAIFVDGRYSLQVKQQVDLRKFEALRLHEDKLEDWLIANGKKGDRIGFDPWLHTPSWVAKMKTALEAQGRELVAVTENPVDMIWQDRPDPAKTTAIPHALQYSGEKSRHKRDRIAAQVKALGADGLVLTSLDSIAWLLNIRGADVNHSPLVTAYLILRSATKVTLYIDPEKVNPALLKHLGKSVKVVDYDQFNQGLAKLGAKKYNILVDPKFTHKAVTDILEKAGAGILYEEDPCILPKACKNDVEKEGSRQAHIRDGVAVCKFLHWFDKNAPSGTLDELAAADKLLDFRKEQALFQDLSFDTISGAGPNGAIVHYRVKPETNRVIENNMLFLIDSGGQYLDGTTDITRTLAVGEPTEEQKDRFTRVLKGHIALAQARFPVGRTGAHLDTLARKSLWDVGLDYEHGTGHGVGSYLNVHEGPQSISQAAFNTPLMPGMILSNEPGYYKAGEYGIRIENLVIVRNSQFEGEEKPMHTLETITFAPIDTRLINAHMMSSSEMTWLNIYHAQVREKISPYLEGEELAWLEKATESLMAL